ncbi:MAG TPA: nitrile hydratase accessory protein [Acidimicrobiia bacterium]
MTEPFRDEVAAMAGAAALPRDNGSVVFAAPWEGRAFALAVTLVERLGLPWDEFRLRLMAAIEDDPDRPYYESWVVALERLVVERGVCGVEALDAAVPDERVPL